MHPRTRLIWAYAAQCIVGSACAIGVALTLAGSGWGAWVLSASLIASNAPAILIGPFVAPLLDTPRLPRLTALLLLIDAAFIALALAFPTPGVLLTMIAAGAITGCLTSPALLTLAQPPDSRDAKGFARMDSARTAGMIAGPPLGGLLIDVTSLRVLLILSCAAALLTALAVVFVPTVHVDGDTSPTWLDRVKEAPVLLLRSPLTRSALGMLAAGIIFTSVFSVTDVLLATRTLGLSGLGYALLTQAFVAGRFLGARLGGLVTQDRARAWLVAGSLVMGCGLGLAGAIPTVVTAAIGFFVSGVANALQVSAIRMIIAQVVGPKILPKALSSMSSINSAAMVAGMVIAAPLLDDLGPAATLIVAGVGTAVPAVVVGTKWVFEYYGRKNTPA